ncbi:MAG: carboxypeptidase regulatory-like domain-containing protein [Pseudomonadota bacterium]|nr:carboxypeptidase regulatory-like domain-containing protein [Pseudomonadota bacterium]
MKRLRVRIGPFLLGVLLLGGLLCAGLVGVLLAVLRPEPADPSLVRAPSAPERTVRNVATDLACSVVIEVVHASGEPAPEAVVRATRAEGGPSNRLADAWAATPALGPDARALLAAPCGSGLNVTAELPGSPQARAFEWVREGEVATLTLTLQPGIRVHGTVTSSDGTPLAEAEVSSGWRQAATTDGDGAYSLWIDADGDRSVQASAFGHHPETRSHLSASEADGPEGVRADFALSARHDVRVWCAGLPDDACGEMPMQCTGPWSPVGQTCESDDDRGETICHCAEGEVAVRGGGRAVRVAADGEEAWLDFRDTGRIVGRVLHEGEAPLYCSVMGARVPAALEDLPRGLVALRRTHCDADGRFVLDGLVAGDWEVHVEAATPTNDGARTPRTLIPRRVKLREEVDVGDILVPGGGGLEGRVVDGVTGAPVSQAPVIAMREGVGGERVTMMGSDAEHDGTFAFEGLPPGTWTVAHMLSPHERVTTSVREGVVTRGIEVVTSDATALDENGFALTEEDGALVVSDVTPESPADDAGLEPGEAVTGVLLGGFDVTSAMGEHGMDAARAILGHWDGPGVTLVVRAADGSEEKVPLEW